MSLFINQKPYLNLSFKAEKRFRFSAMLFCIFMIVTDHYLGNVFTTTAVLMYACFLFPAIYLNRYVQVTYFYHVQNPIIAFRLMCIIVITAMTLVWGIAIVDFILDPPVFPKEERLQELMRQSNSQSDS